MLPCLFFVCRVRNTASMAMHSFFQASTIYTFFLAHDLTQSYRSAVLSRFMHRCWPAVTAKGLERHFRYVTTHIWTQNREMRAKSVTYTCVCLCVRCVTPYAQVVSTPPANEAKADPRTWFFDREVFLTVSAQLQVHTNLHKSYSHIHPHTLTQAEMFACGMGKVYTFGPTFRAESQRWNCVYL